MSIQILKTRIRSLNAEPLGDTEDALRLQLAGMAKKQKAKKDRTAKSDKLKAKLTEQSKRLKKTKKPVKSDKPKTEGESDGKKK